MRERKRTFLSSHRRSRARWLRVAKGTARLERWRRFKTEITGNHLPAGEKFLDFELGAADLRFVRKLAREAGCNVYDMCMRFLREDIG